MLVICRLPIVAHFVVRTPGRSEIESSEPLESGEGEDVYCRGAADNKAVGPWNHQFPSGHSSRPFPPAGSRYLRQDNKNIHRAHPSPGPRVMPLCARAIFHLKRGERRRAGATPAPTQQTHRSMEVHGKLSGSGAGTKLPVRIVAQLSSQTGGLPLDKGVAGR
jgi:hypothetical protein